MQRKDGSWIQVSERRTTEGGMVAVYTDVTELKQREEELAHQTAILEATMEHMGEGIAMFDANLKTIVNNSKFLAMYDLPPDRFSVGSGMGEMLRYSIERGEYGPGDTDAKVNQLIERAVNFAPAVFEHVRQNGTVIEVRRSPIPGGGFESV